MRQMRVVGSALGAVLFASACTTSGGPPSTSPSPGVQVAEMRDSIIAQQIADREGPGVDIRTLFANVSGSRRVQGRFHVDDDAYVLIGHIEADGTVRVIFPLSPEDDGFVKGQKTYQTQEVFAGFVDSYRQRFTTTRMLSASSYQDSYDRGYGYMFIIASWRPMEFGRLSTGAKWDSFELADPAFMDNPREAVQELAATLAGENREAYTVKFARYFTSQALYAGMPGATYSAFGNGFCNGFDSFGFSSFGSLFSPYSFYSGYGPGIIMYRGSAYYADAFGDCYSPYYNPYSSFGYPYGYGYGYRIASTPPYNPPGRRFFDPGAHRTPLTPRTPPPRSLPVAPVTTAPATVSADLPQAASPRYRERGLITSDDPAPRTGRNDPRVQARTAFEDHRRPAIQDMMTHRVQPAANGDDSNEGWSRAQRSPRANGFSNGGDWGSSRTDARGRMRADDGGASSNPRDNNPRGSYRAPQNDSPRSAPSPRTEQVRREPVQRSEPTPRSAPVQRSEPVQRSAPVQRSEPPRTPPPSAPASAGAASSSGASSVRPGTP